MTAARSVRPVRLVVADDDERLRDMLVGLLDDLGYEVVGSYPDGLRAIEHCRVSRPDVVLLDHRMPGLSGAETAQRLHELDASLPVLILSAYDDAGLQNAARQSGVVDYLVKGCTAAEITAAIDLAAGPRLS